MTRHEAYGKLGNSKMAATKKITVGELKKGDSIIERSGTILRVKDIEDKGARVLVHFENDFSSPINPASWQKTEKVSITASMNNRLVASEIVKVANLLVKADSAKQKEYQDYFAGKLKEYGVSSPDKFKSDDDKKKFFDDVKKNWHG